MSRAEDRDTTSSEEGQGRPRTRNEALVHLLGDDDSGIRIKAWRHLEKLGAEAIDSIESAAGGAEDPEVRKHAGRFLREHKRREVFKEWLQFCREPGTDLEEGALLVARSEYPDLDPAACTEALDWYASSLEGGLSGGQQGDSPRSNGANWSQDQAEASQDIAPIRLLRGYGGVDMRI